MADPRNLDDRGAFFEDAAKNRRATRSRVTGNDSRSKADELSRNRNTDVADQLYAAGYLELECMISYTKITEDFATRIWTVGPYSYRYRWLTSDGRWNPPILKKVFFGYDVEGDTIKMFMYANIHDVELTSTRFSPRYDVEISDPGSLLGAWLG